MTARLDPRALTRELLAFNTINPPGMERACARHLGALLEDAGFRVAYHEFAEGRTSLVAQIGGDADKPPGTSTPCRSGMRTGRTTPSRGRPTATVCTGAARPT